MSERVFERASGGSSARRLAVSAPGKLILAGEYAVLRGGLAVVGAVKRRAIAHVAPPDPARTAALSPFLAAAAEILESRADAADAAAVIRRAITVDSSQLRGAAGKLGLGSSAAVTVAAIGAALVATGGPLQRDLVHTLARAAHRRAQGGLGSGADITAATFGGTLWIREGAHGTLALAPATWLPLWTGRSADTVALIRAVEAAHAERPAEVDAATDAIAAAAQALADATGDREAIEAIERGADAIVRLGTAAGLDLETEPVRAARRVARRFGGAVKTCGAGGGDLAIAVLPQDTEVSVVTRAFLEAGCTPLDLPFDPRGVDIDPPGD